MIRQDLKKILQVCSDSLKIVKNILPPTGKNWCKTRNHIYSLSNLGNGMCQMTFLGTFDIYGVENRLIRYLWMLKSPIFRVMPFPRFWKMFKINIFCPLFPVFWQNIHLFKLFKTLISLKPYNKLVSNKFCIITKG